MFKNIATWSNKKLKGISTLVNIVYIFLSLVAPIAVICFQYDLFKTESVEAGKKLNGMFLVLIIAFAVVGLRAFIKTVNKLPDLTYKQQLLKYWLQLIFAIAIPALVVVVLLCFKSNFELAYDTTCICLIFYTSSIVVDKLFLSFIDRENKFRYDAQERLEIERRMGLMK